MSDPGDLLVARAEGLYCPAGDFYIDPWLPVQRALITHAHGDHARPGSASYLAAAPAMHVLRTRLGDISLQTLRYGQRLDIGGVTVSFHPAGHVLGSAQVRLESASGVWVVSGDYKLQADGTCDPFEPVRCDTFVTESTFGLPIYRWRPQAELMAEIDGWWAANAAEHRPSVLLCYAFGKAQRILHGIDASIGPVVCHGAVAALNDAYRASGIPLVRTWRVTDLPDKAMLRGALVLAPPSAAASPWMRRFPGASDAFASGWMRLRGARRRRAVDRGFVLSDHADWPGLCEAIAATGAQRVFVTHGYVPVMVRWLLERGIAARSFETRFGDDEDAGGGDMTGALS